MPHDSADQAGVDGSSTGIATPKDDLPRA